MEEIDEIINEHHESENILQEKYFTGKENTYMIFVSSEKNILHVHNIHTVYCKVLLYLLKEKVSSFKFMFIEK
jgi:hypothetical protein